MCSFRSLRSSIPLLCSAILIALPIAAQAADSAPLLGSTKPLPRIVNGVETFQYPDVVAIASSGSGSTLCSGTMIGCGHVLSAAHCFCVGNDAASCGTPNPGSYVVFGQTFGLATVVDIAIPPDYGFGEQSDLAVLTLAEPVGGVAPALVNTSDPVADGVAGRLVGFGLTEGSARASSGLKRTGLVETAACTVVPDDEHVCWNFTDPLGEPGVDSNTCSGDSGGPLFTGTGADLRLSGVTSGGVASDCLPEDDSFDTEVFNGRAWIQEQVGAGLGGGSCFYGAAGTPGNDIFGTAVDVGGEVPEARFVVPVPEDALSVRVALNAEDGDPFSGGNDFDLYVREGAPPTFDDFDCRPFLFGSYEGCVLDSPTPGPLHILIDPFEGEGRAQVTTTIHTTAASGCIPSETTLCLQGGRFRVEVSWRDFTGETGAGTVVPGRSDESGNFWFFDDENWEQLVKVLDGCALNDHFWVFAASSTTVGYDLTVTDTDSGVQKIYSNPRGTPAVAVTDTEAFATCP